MTRAQRHSPETEPAGQSPETEPAGQSPGTGSPGSGPGTDRPLDGRSTPPRVQRDPWRRVGLVAVVLAVAAGAIVTTSVANSPRFSPYDEATHIDYAWRAAHFELPRSGQALSAFTLEQWSCRGQQNVPRLPPCGIGTPAEGYPAHGLQYNAFHPPGYYAVTGLAARALSKVTGLNFVTSVRSLGAVWLFAAMFGLYLTLRYWRVRWTFAIGGALLLPLLPSVLLASSIVTNDAPAALAGVGALFLLGRVTIHRNTGWVLPVLFTVAAVSTKVLNGLPLLVVAGVFLLMGIQQWKGEGLRRGFPLLRNAMLMVGSTGAVYVGWNLVQSRRQVPDYSNPVGGVNTTPIEGLPFDEWLPTLFKGFWSRSTDHLGLGLGPYATAWATLITTLIVATAFLALATYRRPSPGWIAGGTLLVGSVAYPLVVQIQAASGAYTYFPAVSTRYGISLLPIAVGVLAMTAATRQLRVLGTVLLAVGWTTMLLSVATVTA